MNFISGLIFSRFIEYFKQIIEDKSLIDELFDRLEIRKKSLLFGIFVLHKVKSRVR